VATAVAVASLRTRAMRLDYNGRPEPSRPEPGRKRRDIKEPP
jgi:hypothetical protein